MGKISNAVVVVAVLAFTCGLVAAAQEQKDARDVGFAASAGPYEVSPLETQVLGQRRWLRGGPAALRVIVSDHRSGKPVAARVKLTLTPVSDGKSGVAATQVLSSSTNAAGTLDARFGTEGLRAGPYNLKVSVGSSLGKDEVVERIEIAMSQQILLVTDKPVYQPGQTMHIRALALDAATRGAVAGESLTFEAEDARGNKVFKNRQTLSKFGVAATDFALADEVNMGTFTVRAILPSGQAEKKVRVERYVLPKFKIAITTDRPYYIPGETVKGTVQTDYFFGKPVSGGQVTVTVNTVDIGVTKLAELDGKTDATGAYKFEYTLPTSFVGQPFEQGKAVAEFAARVKDTADHTQAQSKSVPVVKDPVLIVMVPESKRVVPGLQNRLYIACGTPDGTPLADADVAVSIDGRDMLMRLRTDALGLATYAYTPTAGQVTVTARATAKDGRSATASQTYSAAAGSDGILLRTDRTLARVGDRLNLTALSSVKTGTVYIDVIRNKQTILTRAESAHDGQAKLTIPLTNDMVGTLEVHAYKILPNEDIVRDTRTVVVSPADDLVITVKADHQEYRPGAEALLRFAVRSKANQPVAAALGLAIVDESVFALSELQPGLEKVYFMLERELMEPKYEIHGLRASDLVTREPELGAADAPRQRAAALILAAAPASPEFDYRANTYLTRWVAVRDKVLTEMAKVQRRIQQAAQKYQQSNGAPLPASEGLTRLVDLGYLSDRDTRDPWGHAYKVELYGRKDFAAWFTLNSAGPDGKWGTVDDIVGASYNRIMRRGRIQGDFGGGGFGGMADDRARGAIMDRIGEAGPMAAAAPEMEMLAQDAAKDVLRGLATTSSTSGAAGVASPEPRVRQYFPETMYWNPALITDGGGRAELRIPMADSITTWRMSMMANSARGQLGSATAPLRVFQDFFVDIDLPISLTQGDRVEIPIAVYNYLPGEQDVVLTLQQEPWFKLEGDAKQTVRMAKNEVKGIYYPLTVTALGRHTLKVTAHGTKLSDAIMRAIDVTPDGKEIRGVINDRLDSSVEKTVAFPVNAVPGGSSLWVKLYPGSFSQVVEGLDGLLRMPNGCFEQTSSVTYPNVLVTDYLKSTKKINPELQMKAEGFINIGYQRLVTYECKGGGFSWFGNEPAHQILTAYGLLEFGDMAKVHDVDPGLIARTQQWLAGRQKPDGTWPADEQGIAEGIINRQTGALRTAAYIAWALAESGHKGAEITKALGYVKEHRGETKDPYTLALVLNLLTKTERDGETTAAIAAELIGLAKQTDKAAWWEGRHPDVHWSKAGER